eukprot:6228038-Pyramimonas_sp.AAC.2
MPYDIRHQRTTLASFPPRTPACARGGAPLGNDQICQAPGRAKTEALVPILSRETFWRKCPPPPSTLLLLSTETS